MKPAPQQRYQTPGEAAAALGSFLRGRRKDLAPTHRGYVPALLVDSREQTRAITHAKEGADELRKASEARTQAARGFGEATELNKSGLEQFNSAIVLLMDSQADPQRVAGQHPESLLRLRGAVGSLERAESLLITVREQLSQAKMLAQSSRKWLRLARQRMPDDPQIREGASASDRLVYDAGEDLARAAEFAKAVRANRVSVEDNLKRLTDMLRRSELPPSEP